jgi:hypothetical protein
MTTRTIVVAMCCAGLAAWGATATGAAAAETCTPGQTTYGGSQALVFCGPAKATVSVAGQTISFAQGSCEKRQNYLRLDIGMRILGSTSKPKPDYFQVVVGKAPGTADRPVTKDGTYNGLVTAVKGGTEYLAYGSKGKVTLTHKRSRGKFTAKSASGQKITGSFSC